MVSALRKVHSWFMAVYACGLIHHTPFLGYHTKPTTCWTEQVSTRVVTARVCYIPSGSLTSHRINFEELRDGTSGLSSLSERSNHLRMSSWRKLFPLSYLKTLSVGLARAWTHNPLYLRFNGKLLSDKMLTCKGFTRGSNSFGQVTSLEENNSI